MKLCLAEKGNTCILQAFCAEAEVSGAKQTGLQSPWSPGSRGKPYPATIPLQRCLPRAWLSCLHCLPVLLPWGCHKGGAEVNGAKSRINLHVLICSCSQNLVVAWLFSKHRTLPSGGIYGGEERKVRVSKYCLSSSGVLLSLLRWRKHHPLWCLSSPYWYKAGRETLTGYCV